MLVIRVQSEFCWSSPLHGLIFAFSFAFSESFFLENIFLFWTLLLCFRVICIADLSSQTSIFIYFFCFSCFNKRMKTKQNAIHLYTWEFFPLIFIYKVGFYNWMLNRSCLSTFLFVWQPWSPLLCQLTKIYFYFIFLFYLQWTSLDTVTTVPIFCVTYWLWN